MFDLGSYFTVMRNVVSPNEKIKTKHPTPENRKKFNQPRQVQGFFGKIMGVPVGRQLEIGSDAEADGPCHAMDAVYRKEGSNLTSSTLPAIVNQSTAAQ